MDKTDYNNFIWSGFPSYEQLEYLITLGGIHLLKKNESKGEMTAKSRTYNINNYAGRNIKYMVSNRYTYFVGKARECKKELTAQLLDELNDQVIRESLKMVMHWFEYKVPKWLVVIHNIQEYVCRLKGLSPGNYLFYTQQLENGFIQENINLLLDYHIPISAIQKFKN